MSRQIIPITGCPPKVYIRDDEKKGDDDNMMKSYDHNFVDEDKFEYIMPENDTKNCFQDPYVFTATVCAPLCTAVEVMKVAGMYKDKEWRGICCVYFKSLCCFP